MFYKQNYVNSYIRYAFQASSMQWSFESICCNVPNHIFGFAGNRFSVRRELSVLSPPVPIRIHRNQAAKRFLRNFTTLVTGIPIKLVQFRRLPSVNKLQTPAPNYFSSMNASKEIFRLSSSWKRGTGVEKFFPIKRNVKRSKQKDRKLHRFSKRSHCCHFICKARNRSKTERETNEYIC